MLRDTGRKMLGSQGAASSLAAPKPTQTAASLSSQPCTCPSARLSANQGRAWHKEPLSPPLWPQVHEATPGQGGQRGRGRALCFKAPVTEALRCLHPALPNACSGTVFWGKKKAVRRLLSDFASDYPRLPLTRSPSLRSCSWLCPDEITSSPPRSGAPFWVLGQAGRAWGRSQHISQGILPLACPKTVHPTTPPQTPNLACAPALVVPRVPLTAELRAGLRPCGQAEEDQGHHDRGHHGATAPLCRCPLVPAAAGAGAGAGTAVTMAPSVPRGGTPGPLRTAVAAWGPGGGGRGLEGSVGPSRCSAAEQIEGAQPGPQPVPQGDVGDHPDARVP